MAVDISRAIAGVRQCAPAALPENAREIVLQRIRRIWAPPLPGLVNAAKEGGHAFAQVIIARDYEVSVVGKEVRVRMAVQANWLFHGANAAKVRAIANRVLVPAFLEAQRDLNASGLNDYVVVPEVTVLRKERFFP